jgi:hypothetical protein
MTETPSLNAHPKAARVSQWSDDDYGVFDGGPMREKRDT